MDMVKKYIQINQYMKENLKMDSKMDQEFFTQQMVQFIKVNLKMINFMDMEHLYKLLLYSIRHGLIEKDLLKDIGKMV